MRVKGIDNFRKWRDEQKRLGQIKSEYPPLTQNGDLAELIGVILGDGHIHAHARCESLRIVGNADNHGFIERYAWFVEKVFDKKPHVAKRTYSHAINITLYEKNLSERLGIPVGARKDVAYELPSWIRESREYVIRFLRGLYEAEGCLAHHEGTYTHKFQFANVNSSLLDIVFELVTSLGFHPHRSSTQIQVSRKDEVQKLANLLQFRHYGS